MELDELKSTWQNSIQQDINLNKKNMEQIQLILSKKMSDNRNSMKKKYKKIITALLFGIIVNIVMQPFMHFILGDDGPIFRITYGGMLSVLSVISLCVIAILYYWNKYTSLDEFESNQNLKAILQKNIQNLKRSCRQEMILLPISCLLLFVISRYSSEHLGNGDFWDIFHLDIALAMLAGILIVGFYMLKRYSFYKKHIKELSGYLSEYNHKPE